MTLISRLARSEAECEAAMKQAKSASAAAQQLVSSGGDGKEEELEKLKELNKKVLAEKEAALRQGQSVGREYDRLVKELEAVQKEKGQSSDKKEDWGHCRKLFFFFWGKLFFFFFFEETFFFLWGKLFFLKKIVFWFAFSVF